MDKFKIGEIATGQNFTSSVHLNGEDLIIASKYDRYICGIMNGLPCYPPNIMMGYRVIKPDGTKTCVDARNLKRKKPPTTTWEAIESEFNWNPKKVMA